MKNILKRKKLEQLLCSTGLVKKAKEAAAVSSKTFSSKATCHFRRVKLRYDPSAGCATSKRLWSCYTAVIRNSGYVLLQTTHKSNQLRIFARGV